MSRRTMLAEKGSVLDYKDPATLGRFITEGGKIKPRRQTRLSALQQRDLAVQIKRARHLAFVAAADND
jgi:small subunit ribosomal protein S18